MLKTDTDIFKKILPIFGQ